MTRFRDLYNRDVPKAVLLRENEQVRDGDVLVTGAKEKRYSVRPNQKCAFCRGQGIASYVHEDGPEERQCDCVKLVLKNELERGRVDVTMIEITGSLS